jgi:hypothetical protein
MFVFLFFLIALFSEIQARRRMNKMRNARAAALKLLVCQRRSYGILVVAVTCFRPLGCEEGAFREQVQN